MSRTFLGFVSIPLFLWQAPAPAAAAAEVPIQLHVETLRVEGGWYAMLRLPYTVRGAYAALQQLPVDLEEAGQNLGANRARTFVKITLPLMARGLLAGGLLAFISSAVDLSATILLVPRVELGPLSYGIYLYMQSAVGRGPGAALGVVAILLVAAGTWAATALTRRSGGALFRT